MINKRIFNIKDSLRGSRSGSSPKFFEAPILLMYTSCTAQSLAAWLLALPLGLYGQVVESLHDDTRHGVQCRG
jgi:hypothetical protein